MLTTIFLEGSITLLLFATFWLIFCELYSQPKNRRIPLVIGMALFRPVWAPLQINYTNEK
jgi:hypothetical protein